MTHIVPHKKFVEAIQEVQEGKFQPDRENDELTKALKN
jgi:DNA-directed RNA polymerase subunit K/omega